MTKKNYQPSLKQIRYAAEVLFGSHIWKKTRKREVIRLRQISHFVAHGIYKHSSAKVGYEMGKKDHATVLSGCNVIASEMEIYPAIKEKVIRLSKKVSMKESSEPIEKILLGMIKSRTIDPNVRCELRSLLKIYKNESI